MPLAFGHGVFQDPGDGEDRAGGTIALPARPQAHFGKCGPEVHRLGGRRSVQGRLNRQKTRIEHRTQHDGHALHRGHRGRKPQMDLLAG